MGGKKIVVLDGAGINDKDLGPILDVLCGVLRADGGEVAIYPLREMKLAHCLGCFDCWVKTPGVCREKDAGREAIKEVIRSDVTVLFTPVTFGGYSAELKRIVDRFVQLIPPLFSMDHGEVHHPPRYTHRPRLVVVGIQRQLNATEARIFKVLAGRNAINLHTPSYAAEVVQCTNGEETLRGRFEALLSRSDSLPYGDTVAALMPEAVAPDAEVKKEEMRRALLLVGSPKTNEPSTSGALGGFLLDCLKQRGWETEAVTLRANLNRAEGEAELVAAMEGAGLILLAFPLYVDALPYLMTKALTTIAANRTMDREPRRQRLVAVVNSGFPEAHQNAVALAICREFAGRCGFTWDGGLAFGGGEMIGGHPLHEAKRPGPPVRNVIAALEMTAKCLSEGLPVPAAAMGLIAERPLARAIFNRFYMWMATRSFEKHAARNGISKKELRAQPYAA